MSIWKIEGVGLPFNESKRRIDETVDFPKGYGTWAVMLFTTPFEVCCQGKIYQRQGGDFLINRPDTPMWHRGLNVGYQNYWIHFYGPGIAKELERYNFSLDKPFAPPMDYSGLFREIHWESIEKPAYYKESMSRHLQHLFLSLHRDLTRLGEDSTGKENKRKKEFLDLRRQISRELTTPWTIPLMAGALSLSPSRFAALYREYFDISPLNDLNSCRLEYARQLLSNPSISVKQAAWESGFRDLPYFNRYFKTHTGMTPGNWRKKQWKTL